MAAPTRAAAPSPDRRDESARVTMRSRDNRVVYVRDKATRDTLVRADRILLKLAKSPGRTRKSA